MQYLSRTWEQAILLRSRMGQLILQLYNTYSLIE